MGLRFERANVRSHSYPGSNHHKTRGFSVPDVVALGVKNSHGLSFYDVVRINSSDVV